jgi:glyoxylase-like metal-dependent hydrolase (beta-lactamase superfamily II)
MRTAHLATAAIAACLSLAADAAPKSWGPFTYETIRVADNVYAFDEPKLNGIVSSNIIAVIGDSSILVFDSGHHPPVTRAIAREIRKLSDKPVSYVAISHWHDDHWVGNAEFAAAWPDVQFIAHPFTAQLMETRRDKLNGAACRDPLVKQVKPLREQLAAGKHENGTPISEKGKAFLRDDISGYDQSIVECGEARYRGVDLTFETELRIDLGGRMVRLLHLGRGNTAGDIVAYVPDAKLLLAGDVVVYPFPFATQSYISEWAAGLRRIDAMDVDIIVPGHGAVQHDKRYIEDLAALFESLGAQGHAAWRPGMSADALRKKIDIAPWSEKFSHGDAFIKANFDYMIGQPAIDRLWQELSGRWKPEGDD